MASGANARAGPSSPSEVNLSGDQINSFIKQKFLRLVNSMKNFQENPSTSLSYWEAGNLLLSLCLFWLDRNRHLNVLLFLDNWINFLVSTSSREGIPIQVQIEVHLDLFCKWYPIRISTSERMGIIRNFRKVCKLYWTGGFIVYNSQETLAEIRSYFFA